MAAAWGGVQAHGIDSTAASGQRNGGRGGESSSDRSRRRYLLTRRNQPGRPWRCRLNWRERSANQPCLLIATSDHGSNLGQMPAGFDGFRAFPAASAPMATRWDPLP